MWPYTTGPYVGANYWRGGYFDYGGFDARRLIELSRLVDPSQMFDPLFDPSQMVDLSQGIDLSRTRGVDLPEDDLLQPIPGPGIVGLYGLFEGDFRRAGDDVPEPPPRKRGLLLLGRKKKAWRPRRLAVSGRRRALGWFA